MKGEKTPQKRGLRENDLFVCGETDPKTKPPTEGKGSKPWAAKGNKRKIKGWGILNRSKGGLLGRGFKRCRRSEGEIVFTPKNTMVRRAMMDFSIGKKGLPR